MRNAIRRNSNLPDIQVCEITVRNLTSESDIAGLILSKEMAPKNPFTNRF